MLFSQFQLADLPLLPDFQPEGWDDLITTFTYFINSPNCFPIKLSIENETVAIATSIRHIDTAWLACIVVHRNYRGRGLGRAITNELINRLDARVFKTIYLDATDEGYEVYTKLGFEMEDNYIHYKNSSQKRQSLPAVHPHIRTYQPKDFHQLFHLDYKATGEYRKAILSDWISEAIVYEEAGFVQGYYLPDRSNRLIIARSRPVGKALLNYHIDRHHIVIPPSGNTYAIDFLKENGFEPYRATKRMRLGVTRPVNLQMLFNRLSGQLG
jgi:ribosomal protein S18 acetylase RimI-like enzyme